MIPKPATGQEQARLECRQCLTKANADVIGGENIRRLDVAARAGQKTRRARVDRNTTQFRSFLK